MFHISRVLHGQYLSGKKTQVQFLKGHSLPDRSFHTTLLFLQGQIQAGDQYPLMVLGKLEDEAGGLSSCVLHRCLGFVASCRAQMCCYSPALWGTEGLRAGAAGAAGGERLLPGAIPTGFGTRDVGCGMWDAGCGTEPPALSQPKALAILGCRPDSLSSQAESRWSYRSCRAVLA